MTQELGKIIKFLYEKGKRFSFDDMHEEVVIWNKDPSFYEVLKKQFTLVNKSAYTEKITYIPYDTETR